MRNSMPAWGSSTRSPASSSTTCAPNSRSANRLSVTDAIAVREQRRAVAAAPLVAVAALRLDLHDVVLLAGAGRVVGRQPAAEETDVLIQIVEAVPHRAAGPRLDRVVHVVGAARGTADV